MSDDKDRELWVGVFIWVAALLFVGSAVVVWHTDQTDTIILEPGSEASSYGSNQRATLMGFGFVMILSLLALLGGILLRVWID
jgi:hypothetical protein